MQLAAGGFRVVFYPLTLALSRRERESLIRDRRDISGAMRCAFFARRTLS